MNTSKRRVVLASVLSLSLIAAACGSDDKEATSTTAAAAATTEAVTTETEATTAETAAATTAAPEETTAETTAGTDSGATAEIAGGEVFISGSSTVEPIAVLVAELADSLSGGELAVSVEGPGTGDGFAKFCEGEADISNASRPIKDEEAQLCADAGIEFVELAVAIDGLTVATSIANTAVPCLDVPALYALLGPESEGFGNWSDAIPLATELESTTVDLPDAPLDITGPGVESGTYDSLVEFVAKSIAEDREQEVKFRSDYTQSANDNLIIEGIEASDTSLGWVGFAFYEVEKDRMNAIAIDAGDGCVAPTTETIADGTYPFSRTLYIYVSKNAMADNPAVASFVDIFLSDDGIAQVSEAGYVQLGDEELGASIDAWAAAQG